MLQRAENENADMYDRLGAMCNLAETWLAMEECEKAVDKCEQIFSLDGEYYPAYLIRQQGSG